jgi:hypothetical protein
MQFQVIVNEKANPEKNIAKISASNLLLNVCESEGLGGNG